MGWCHPSNADAAAIAMSRLPNTLRRGPLGDRLTDVSGGHFRGIAESEGTLKAGRYSCLIPHGIEQNFTRLVGLPFFLGIREKYKEGSVSSVQ